MLLVYDPVGDGPSAYDVYVRHLRAEQQCDDQRDLSSRDARERSVVSPESLCVVRNVPLAAQSGLDAGDAPARFRLKRKRDLQEALTQHYIPKTSFTPGVPHSESIASLYWRNAHDAGVRKIYGDLLLGENTFLLAF